MLEFPEKLFIPMDKWIDNIMDWILVNLGGLFDAIGGVLLKILIVIEKALLWVPWPVVLIFIGVLAWRAMGKWWHGVVMAGLIFTVGLFGYWDYAMTTLAIVVASVVVSLLIGFPTGILMARSDRFQGILRPILDGMQTMPSFVYLIPAMMLFGLGKVPAVPSSGSLTWASEGSLRVWWRRPGLSVPVTVSSSSTSSCLWPSPAS
jgi:glycine betaine/proline transport system permease protein